LKQCDIKKTEQETGSTATEKTGKHTCDVFHMADQVEPDTE